MTTQVLYNKVKSNEISEQKFLMEVKKDDKFTNLFHVSNTFEDVVNILKNKGIITEGEDIKIEKFDLNSAIQKMNEGQKLKGGKGDKLTPDQVNYYEFQKGWRHELEHTDDIDKAKEIALDHLSEDPIYYTRLDMIELKANKKKRTDLPLEVKKDQMKDPDNQMEKVKKISNSNSGKQETKKLEEPKKNVGNKKERPKKIKVKTMKGGSGKETSKPLNENAVQGKLFDKETLEKDKVDVRKVMTAYKDITDKKKGEHGADLNPAEKIRLKWLLKAYKDKKAKVSETIEAGEFGIKDLKHNQKYNYTGGAEFFDLIYIGTRQEHPEIQVGSSQGKGFIFQFGDTPGRYMEFNAQAVKQYIEPITTESLYEESSLTTPGKYELVYSTPKEPKKELKTNVDITDISKFKKQIAPKLNIKSLKRIGDIKPQTEKRRVEIIIPDASKGQKKGDKFTFDKKQIEDHITKHGEDSLKFVDQSYSTSDPKKDSNTDMSKLNPRKVDALGVKAAPSKPSLSRTTGAWQVVDIDSQETVTAYNSRQAAKDFITNSKKNYIELPALKVKAAGGELKPAADMNEDLLEFRKIIRGILENKLKEYTGNIEKEGPAVKKKELERLLQGYNWDEPENNYQQLNKQGSTQKIIELVKDLGAEGIALYRAYNPNVKGVEVNEENVVENKLLKVLLGGLLIGGSYYGINKADKLNKEEKAKTEQIVNKYGDQLQKMSRSEMLNLHNSILKKYPEDRDYIIKGSDFFDKGFNLKHGNDGEKILTIDRIVKAMVDHPEDFEGLSLKASSKVNEDHLNTREDKIDYILQTSGFLGKREDLDKLSDSDIDKAYKNAELKRKQKESSFKQNVDLSKSFDKIK